MNEQASLSLAWLRGMLEAVACVVIIEAALGFAGATVAAAPLLALAAVVASMLAARRGWRALRGPSGETTTARGAATADLLAALALAAALGSRLGAGLHHAGGAFTYDVLSYHLHLPASWWAAGRVGVVPTPFGDQAPAYAPANAELTYLLALATTGNLRLAHAGQAAYAALATVAIVATARQLGVSRRLAVGAALAFLMIPEVWQQAAGAMADLALAAFLLASLPFLLRLRDHRDRRDLLALGAALGLALGTKYVGAVLALPLLAATAWLLVRHGRARGWRRPAGDAITLVTLVFACGGFWYVRNALLTGDPTFPVTLQLGGLTLGRGLYGGVEMRRWLYHLPIADLEPLLEMFTESGWGFLLCLAAGFTASLLRRRALAACLFAAYVGLAWLVVPYQQSRFLFAAWGIGALATAVAAQAGGPVVRELAFAPAIAGAAWQYSTPARLLTAALWTLAAALGTRGTSALAPARTARYTAAAAWLGVPAVGVLALGLIGWTRLPAHADPQAARIGDGHDAGWDHVRAHLHGRRIAYSGSNLPLPLWGWHLENRVRYVNVGGKLADVLHDFPASTTGAGTAEPAPERARPDRAAWLANLTAARTDALFVARLYPDVAPSMPHDADGFPTERAWADALPERFRLTFATPDVRIYDVRPDAERERPWPVDASQDPPR